MLIRSVSGVRGLAGVDLTPSDARRYGRAFGKLFAGDMLVAWDSRPGGDVLERAVAAGLADVGRSVVDAGVVPTPTVGIAVRTRGLGGGVMVTASHNPEEYNGLKFFGPSGVFLDAADAGRLFAEADGEAEPVPGDDPAVPPPAAGDVVSEHIELILSSDFVNLEAVRQAEPAVVVDCVNAAGSVILPMLLRSMGCRVTEINTDAGAGFPHGAEPVPENLDELRRAVRQAGADVGLACDPDADRLAMVDENGNAVGEEYTLALAARVVLSSRRGPVVANVSTSRMLDDVASEFGVPIARTPIGEINVAMKMREIGAVVGGEGNGGVILPDVHLGRDASTAAALVVSALAAARPATLGDITRRFRSYSMVKTKLPLGALTREGIVSAMAAAFPEGGSDLTDGAKIIWPDRWIHARMSGTEPAIRLIAEASEADDAADLIRRAKAALAEGTKEAEQCAE